MSKMKTKYDAAKAAAVGETVTCPSCGASFVKTRKDQAFCKTKPGTQCKDKYWNTVVPGKKCNTTRISPASAAYMERTKDERVTRYTSEGYRIIGGVAYDEFDDPVYDVDPYDDM